MTSPAFLPLGLLDLIWVVFACFQLEDPVFSPRTLLAWSWLHVGSLASSQKAQLSFLSVTTSCSFISLVNVCWGSRVVQVACPLGKVALARQSWLWALSAARPVVRAPWGGVLAENWVGSVYTGALQPRAGGWIMNELVFVLVGWIQCSADRCLCLSSSHPSLSDLPDSPVRLFFLFLHWRQLGRVCRRDPPRTSWQWECPLCAWAFSSGCGPPGPPSAFIRCVSSGTRDSGVVRMVCRRSQDTSFSIGLHWLLPCLYLPSRVQQRRRYFSCSVTWDS